MANCQWYDIGIVPWHSIYVCMFLRLRLGYTNSARILKSFPPDDNESSKGTRAGCVVYDESVDTRRSRRVGSHRRRCPSNTEVKSDASHQPLEASGDAPRWVSLSATRHQLKYSLCSYVYAAFAIECLSYVSRDVAVIVRVLDGDGIMCSPKRNRDKSSPRACVF